MPAVAGRLTVAMACLAASAAVTGGAQELPRGQIIDAVMYAGDPTQTYSLYLPGSFVPSKSWNLLMGFHPGARGRAIVEKYRAAAEEYGYIVAGSNNSRNGAWAVSGQAIQAMSADLGQRFPIAQNRVYLTGHSGGARVAMQVALGKSRIAGVIASSAGYPDSRPRSSVPFAIFGTAGRDDFNYIEMRMLDRTLKTPHRVVIFDGGHTLPPDDVALEAIEWMELQAMRSGLRSPDSALIERLYLKRQPAIASAGESAAALHLVQAVADDFKGLRDVTAEVARAAELSRKKEIKAALARERDDDNAEARLLDEFVMLEAGLRSDDQHLESLARLRALLARLSKQADSAADTPERGRARRTLRTITTGASERVQDEDYLKLLQQYRPAGTGRGSLAAGLSGRD